MTRFRLCEITAITFYAARAATTHLTQMQQQAILDTHNELRAGVTAPCTAADMEKLAWDEGLAAKAQARAETCKLEATSPSSDVAENVAMALENA